MEMVLMQKTCSVSGCPLRTNILPGLILGFFIIGALTMTKPSDDQSIRKDIEKRMQKYALTPMSFDASSFPEREKTLLKLLLKASHEADEIFWLQTYHGNKKLRTEILKKYGPDDIIRQFFIMQAGPFDRLDHNAPFLPVPPKPPTAGFYPPDMTKEEFQKWIQEHPEDREAFMSPYTVIRRKGNRLVAIPYHIAYKPMVTRMAQALREAVKYTSNPSFKRFLEKKAGAVLTDEYYDADVAWIDVKGSLFDLTLGPFEVYEDELMNLKASYEASVMIVDQEASRDLEKYKTYLAEMEKALPYPDEYKPQAVKLTAAFTIVRDVYRGGDIRVGYQPVAANLPNDPKVHTTKGTKKIFWRNVMEARVKKIIEPIARRSIAQDQVRYMTSEGFFHFVLFHEIAHGLGPRFVRNTKTPVNVRLKELYSWIEENKADIVGLFVLRLLEKKKVFDPALRMEHAVSYLGSLFRTIRFGTGEAHGKAALISLNFFMEKGAIVYDAKSQRFRVVIEKFDHAVRDLARILLMIECQGDYEGALKLAKKYGTMPEALSATLDTLKDLPIDVVPQYSIRWD